MKIKNLNKTYKPKSGEVKALDNVSFDLPEKGMVFILGKSGSGKSTLLNILSGLDSADVGSVIEVCGTNIVDCSASERDGYRNSCCGFVFQEYNLIPELNVKENIMLSCQLQGDKDNEQKVNATLEKVELNGYGDRKITELSGGQKQRVAIARAIVKDPRIIFADEPTGALDEGTGESIFNLLKEIAKDRLVVVVSHDREFAAQYGDRIIELASGKIVSDSDNEYIADEQSKVELKKPRLPIKAAAKIGCANFKFHPIRLVATILLSVIAFTFLGVALSSALNSYDNIVYNAMIADGVKYSALYGEYNETAMSRVITADQKRAIDKALGASLGVVAANEVEVSGSSDNIYDSVLPFGFAEITSQIAGEYGLSVVGRLPAERGEVAVTAFSADILNRLEYNKSDHAGIVGESLAVGERDYRIVGIIDTHFDSGMFETLKTTDNAVKLEEMYYNTLISTPHNLMFVCEDSGLFGANYDIVIVRNSDGVAPYISGKNGLMLNNNTVLNADTYKKTISGINKAAGILAAVFFVFAAILLLNFLLQSFTDKLFSLGILKANGCNAGGLIKVFLCEAFVIAAVVFAISSVLTVVCGAILNANFGVAFFGMYYATLPIVLVGVAAVAVLACIMPIVKIARMTPVDVIRQSN